MKNTFTTIITIFMKNIFTASIIVLMILSIASFAPKASEETAQTYEKTVTLVKIIEAEDVAIFVDDNGEAWEWEGTEGFKVGNEYTLTFDNMNTESIYDDEIILIK